MKERVMEQIRNAKNLRQVRVWAEILELAEYAEAEYAEKEPEAEICFIRLLETGLAIARARNKKIDTEIYTAAIKIFKKEE